MVDRAGRWHQLSIPAARFNEETLSEGIGFDGSSYGFLTVEKSDMVFRPDLSTAFLDPFSEQKTLVMIANIYRIEGSERIRFEDDPRFVAQKTERVLAEKGIADQVFLGPEFEFYVLDKIAFRNEINHMEVYIDSAQAEWNSGLKDGCSGLTVPAGGGYHLDIPFDTSCGLRNEAVRLLETLGVPVKYHHSENGGPGQVEIEVNFATLLCMADGTQKLKYVVRNEAIRQGKTVTFMPKPFAREAG
ncbi:MAG TPA: glutamine synthetase, partial [Synergistaceae bacterium]|nr:glutamine synthetase [Synergistaceae bacterium]